MTSSPGTSSLPSQVAALGLPSVGQRLGLQLQVEAGVLGGPGGTEGGAAGGNNLEAGPGTSHSVAWCHLVSGGEGGTVLRTF